MSQLGMYWMRLSATSGESNEQSLLEKWNDNRGLGLLDQRSIKKAIDVIPRPNRLLLICCPMSHPRCGEPLKQTIHRQRNSLMVGSQHSGQRILSGAQCGQEVMDALSVCRAFSSESAQRECEPEHCLPVLCQRVEFLWRTDGCLWKRE